MSLDITSQSVQPINFVTNGTPGATRKAWRPLSQWQIMADISNSIAPVDAELGGANRQFLRFDVAEANPSITKLQWVEDASPAKADKRYRYSVTINSTFDPAEIREIEKFANVAEEEAESSLIGRSQVSLNSNEVIRARYSKLLTEAAHDIRSPIATASQLITTVTARAREHKGITSQELSLLDIADQRLAQASNWASTILVESRLAGLSTRSLRKRFYPQQWLSLMQPLLHSIANDHNVRLIWVGWERSLPKLYLDVNHLSRIVLNLVTNAIQASDAGGQVVIRSSWDKSQSPRLVIQIEDQGVGLSQEILREINATLTSADTLALPQSRQGVGLHTVRRLVASLGASISAQRRTGKGSEVRLTLPIDEPQSLIRNWLIHRAATVEGLAAEQKQRCRVFGIRWLDENLSTADTELQRFSSENDFVYRIARDRWLMFTTLDGILVSSTLDEFSADLKRRVGRETVRYGELGKGAEFTFGSLQVSADSGRGLPAIVGELEEIVADATRSMLPSVDDLDAEFGRSYNETMHQCIARVNKRQRFDPAQGSVRTHLQPSMEHERKESSSSISEALGEVAHGWKQTQQRLKRGQPHRV